MYSGAVMQKNKKTNAESWLVFLFFITLVFHFFNIYIFHFSNIKIRFHSVFGVIYGPLIWLYIRTLCEKGFVPGKRELLHFTPAAFLFVFILTAMLRNEQSNLLFIQPIVFVQTFAYLIGAFIKMNKSGKWRQPAMNWVRWFLIIFTFLISIAFIDYLRWAYNWQIANTLTFSALLSAALLLTSWLVFQGLCQNVFVQKKDILSGSSKGRYAQVFLTLGEKNDLVCRIQSYFEEHKPYLDSHLSINDLAEKMDVPAYILSRAINENFGQNFPEYVNTHRIQTAKHLLIHSDLKILAVAFDSGFSNKTSFNRVFRKSTQLTPSKFRDLSI